MDLHAGCPFETAVESASRTFKEYRMRDDTRRSLPRKSVSVGD